MGSRRHGVRRVAAVGHIQHHSITAALGSAAGGRTHAAVAETATTGARDRAQTAYDTAKKSLDKLAPSRLAPEVDALLIDARKRPAAHGCRRIHEFLVNCPGLEAELGRAHERKRLEAALDRASKNLEAPPPPPANTDSAALRRYLLAIGVDMTADRLNDLLVLLSVLMLEAGGGLALSLGMALAGAPAGRTEAPAGQPVSEPPAAESPSAASLNAPAEHSERTPRTLASGVRLLPVRPSGALSWLTERGGRATISMRQLGIVLGRSASAVHDELHRLAASGVVTLTPGSRGTAIQLVVSGN